MLMTVALYYNLKSGNLILQALFFFLEISLAIWVLCVCVCVCVCVSIQIINIFALVL